MTYTITLINPGEKQELEERYMQEVRYEIKSEMYGRCIRDLSDEPASMAVGRIGDWCYHMIR